MSSSSCSADRANPAVLRIERASKTFGGHRALDDVTFSLEKGEVHALLGQNGSGKSTLIKMLAGYHRPDQHTQIFINGNAYALPLRAEQSVELGLSFVHQDLGLINYLTVAENVRAPFVTAKGQWWINMREQCRYTCALFEKYGIAVSPDARVQDLTRSDRALIAIARAMDCLDSARQRNGEASGVIFLDETTAYLPLEGIKSLFALVRQFTERGGAAVFVSHDLDEALTHADRITVLRDGKHVATTITAGLTHAELVEMLVGRSIERQPRDQTRVRGSKAVRVRGLSGTRVRDVDLDVHQGEILGLTGILGSGFDEIADLIFGAIPAKSGAMGFAGRSIDLKQMTPRFAVQNGIALIPSDRLNEGGIQSLCIDDNAGMQITATLGRSWGLNRKADRRANAQLIREFGVIPPEPRRLMSQLSGGNQQKVILSKWLRSNPWFVLMQEPTQGVDIGARADIYEILRKSRERGASIICASSDHDQLAEICDRVLVFKDGKQVRELVGRQVEKTEISSACLLN